MSRMNKKDGVWYQTSGNVDYSEIDNLKQSLNNKGKSTLLLDIVPTSTLTNHTIDDITKYSSLVFCLCYGSRVMASTIIPSTIFSQVLVNSSGGVGGDANVAQISTTPIYYLYCTKASNTSVGVFLNTTFSANKVRIYGIE